MKDTEQLRNWREVEQTEEQEWETLPTIEYGAVKTEHRSGTTIWKMTQSLLSERGYSLLQHQNNYVYACSVKKPTDKTGSVQRYTRRLAAGLNGIPQIKRNSKHPMRTRFRVVQPLQRLN